MLKRKYSLLLFILFFQFSISDEIIQINTASSTQEIKTKYGIVSYEKRNTFESDRSYSFSYYIQVSNLKNLTNVNFPELRKKYEKYKVTVFLDGLDAVRINFIEFNIRICYLILTEILYKTSYINKKICIFDNDENVVYFGSDDFINKNLKKFTFYSNDTFTQIITSNSSYTIPKTINFIDFLSIFTFDLIINKLLFGNKYKNFFIGGDNVHTYENGKYNISFKLNNKLLKLGNVKKGIIYSNSFFENFFYSQYDLDKNEFTFYLSPYKYKDGLVSELNEEIIYKTSNISIIIYFFIVLGITYAIISRNKKRKNEEYPINITDVY